MIYVCVPSKIFQFYLFADDTNIYANKNLKSLEAVVNRDTEIR